MPLAEGERAVIETDDGLFIVGWVRFDDYATPILLPATKEEIDARR